MIPVLLTERREHLDLVASMLEKHIQYVIKSDPAKPDRRLCLALYN